MTIEYLDREGQVLKDLATGAKSLESSLDDAALADRCKRLSKQWDQQYGNPYQRLVGLADSDLADLYADQLDWIRSAFYECRRNDRQKATEAARSAAGLASKIDGRVAELEGDR